MPDARIWNKVFLARGKRSYRVENPERGEFKNNGYFGTWTNLPADTGKVIGQPMLANPGGAGDIGKNLEAYRPPTSSPCRKRGTVVDNPGGRDIIGAKLLPGISPSIGACQ